jgi:hypothetical protein
MNLKARVTALEVREGVLTEACVFLGSRVADLERERGLDA